MCAGFLAQSEQASLDARKWSLANSDCTPRGDLVADGSGLALMKIAHARGSRRATADTLRMQRWQAIPSVPRE